MCLTLADPAEGSASVKHTLKPARFEIADALAKDIARLAKNSKSPSSAAKNEAMKPRRSLSNETGGQQLFFRIHSSADSGGVDVPPIPLSAA